MIHLDFLNYDYNSDPILVNKINGKYKLIDGTCRLACHLFFKRKINYNLLNNFLGKIEILPKFFKNKNKFKNHFPLSNDSTTDSFDQSYIDYAIIEYSKIKLNNVKTVSFISDSFSDEYSKFINILKYFDIGYIHSKTISYNKRSKEFRTYNKYLF